MSSELNLAAGYREGRPLSPSGAPRLVFGGAELQLVDLALEPRERAPVGSGINCPLAVDSEGERIYYSDGPIHCWDRRAGEGRLVFVPPEFDVDAGKARENSRFLPDELRDDPFLAHPHFVWLLALDPEARELVSLAQSPDGQSKVARMPLDGERPSAIAVEGHCAGLTVDFRTRRLIQPAHLEGPRAIDLDRGEVIARFPDELRGSAVPAFGSAAPHPQTDDVILGSWGGLVRWSLAEDRSEVIDEHGWYPSWSADGERLFYLVGDGELWVREGNEPPLRLVALEGARSSLPSSASYAGPPVPSPCGRFVYAQLTRADVASGESPHVALVIDLEAKDVHAVPGVYHHNVAWL